MRARPLAVAVLVALAAVLLTGCSSAVSGKASPGSAVGNGERWKKGPEVAADAADALQQAGSVHLSGTVSSGGQQTQLDLFVQGTDASGSISLAGQQVQIIATGGKAYLKAPAAFWSSQGIPSALAGQLGGQWVIVPADTPKGLGFVSLSALTAELRQPSDGTTIQDGVTTAQLDGKPVVVVSQSDGSTLSVAAEGTPYPLKAESKGSSPGTLTLSQFGTRQDISAPPNPLNPNDIGG